MASGTGEFDGNTVTAAGGSQFYRYIHITGQDFDHDTGLTTVHYYIGTWVESGSLGGTTVRSEGTCDDSYQVYGRGRYDFHDALSVTNGHVGDGFRFWERASYTGGSGAWYASTLDMVWYPDVPSYTLTYDPNGGAGAPGAQTKSWGSKQLVSSSKPTRDLYSFAGWNTEPDGTGTAYAPGQAWSSNADVALYAMWELAYLPPSVSIDECWRTGPSNKAADDGTRLHVKASYRADTSIDPTNKVKTVSIEYRENGSSEWKTAYANGDVGAASGEYTLDYSGGTLDTDKQYDVRATVTDTYGPSHSVPASTYTARASSVLTMSFFTMDFLKGGRGVAIGQPATAEGLHVSMQANLHEPVFMDGPATLAGAPIAAMKTLFDGSTTGTVTLSEKASDYTYLQVFFGYGDDKRDSQMMCASEGSRLDHCMFFMVGTTLWIKTRGIKVVGNTLVNDARSGNWAFSGGGFAYSDTYSTPEIEILRVVGIR